MGLEDDRLERLERHNVGLLAENASLRREIGRLRDLLGVGDEQHDLAIWQAANSTDGFDLSEAERLVRATAAVSPKQSGSMALPLIAVCQIVAAMLDDLREVPTTVAEAE